MTIEIPESLHPDTAALVVEFAEALAKKLAGSQEKYGFSNDWSKKDWEAECQKDLAAHVQKGDPLDVAAYAAFCWKHNWPTAPKA